MADKKIPKSLQQAAQQAISFEKREMELLRQTNAKLKRDLQRVSRDNFINLRVYHETLNCHISFSFSSSGE